MFIEAKKTKIVATIGPASDTPEKIERLLRLGVNVFRFNMKHNTVPWHEERIRLVTEIADRIEKPVGILVDLQGPELRLETREKKQINVKKGEELIVSFDLSNPNASVCLPEKSVFGQMNVGDQFLIDDGFLEFVVTKVDGLNLYIRANDDYTISHRKGVNLPGKKFDFSSLIPADIEKLDMSTRVKVDFIALSFCRSRADLELLKSEIEKRQLKVHTVAKIESGEALENIEEILVVADAVMVARGDLGVECPIEQLAYWQKKIVRLCRSKHKPVIVATQMLQSMVDNPRPTRAEATDVSNAVWDGADAVMLSGETAFGKFPEKAVDAMAKIVYYNEQQVDYTELTLPQYDNTEAVVSSAVQLSVNHSQVSGILVFTDRGLTPRVLASFRPKLPIIAVAHNPKVADILTLSYGVIPIKHDFPEGEFKVPPEILDRLEIEELMKKGSDVIVIHGSHWRKPGETNSMALVKV